MVLVGFVLLGVFMLLCVIADTGAINESNTRMKNRSNWHYKRLDEWHDLVSGRALEEDLSYFIRSHENEALSILLARRGKVRDNTWCGGDIVGLALGEGQYTQETLGIGRSISGYTSGTNCAGKE